MEHLDYYLPLCGDWSGPLSFSFDALPSARGATPGAWTMHTTLRRAGELEMAHTTRVERRGITLFSSAERIILDPDGRRFVLRGAARKPLGWPSLDAEGEVTGASAEYRFTWMGASLIQRTQVVAEGLRVHQRTRFFSAETVLRRQ